MSRCTFKQGNFNCGSYAFNLYKEDIDQGSYCDHHYWQDQAIKARADERENGQRWFDAVTAQHKQLILAEREACAKVAEKLTWADNKGVASAIRARSST